MAYATGQVIAAADYNGLAQTTTGGNVAWVLGTGHGAAGYGQNTTGIATVSSTATVTATQWSGLIYLVNRALGHQSGAAAQLGSGSNIGVAAGATITAFANVATAVTNINANVALFAAQGSTTTGTTDTTNPTAGAQSSFSYFRDVNVTFTSANAARYFFNAGGQINFVCTATSGANNTRSNTLRDMINQVGGLGAFRNTTNTGRTGTGGTIVTNITAFGYRNLTASAQNIVDNNVAGTYSSHDVKIQLLSNSIDTTNGSNGASVVFRLLTTADADDEFGGSINLSISVRADVVFPSTTYLNDVWGTPAITFDSA
jgi:hypothetical protein